MSSTGSFRLIISLGMALALIAGQLPPRPVPIAGAAASVGLPFVGGQAARIIQGYSGGTHQGRSQYGLDLVLAGGGTSGAEVVSPIEGAVSWAQPPDGGNGCLAIAFRDGSYNVVLCHVLFHKAFGHGEAVARGQSLGTVGAAGTVGNNGSPHVHLELHRGGRSSSPVPFSPPDGLLLEGVDLPASGAHTQREPITSTNRPGSAAQPAASARPERPPAERPAALAPAAARSAPPAPTGQAANPAPDRAAIVQGTGSCLNVRAQPAADASIVDCLKDGAEVALAPLAAGATSDWRQIEGKGWVATEFLKRTRAVVAGAESCLNVRESPSTGAPSLGCLPEGTPVAIAEGPAAGGEFHWYRIEPPVSLARGGWVVGQYLD